MKALGYRDLADFGITYSREAIARLIKAGQFPASFKLSEHRIAWRENDVNEWLAQRSSSTAKPKPVVVTRAPQPSPQWRRRLPAIAVPPRRKAVADRASRICTGRRQAHVRTSDAADQLVAVWAYQNWLVQGRAGRGTGSLTERASNAHGGPN